MKRWVLPIAAAAAVLLLIGGLWYFAGSGPRDGESSFAGGDTASGGDDSTSTGSTGPDSGSDDGVTGSDGGGSGGGVTGSPGSGPGSTEPGFPGSADPGTGTQPDDSVHAMPTNPLAVRVDNYYRYDGQHVVLSYTIGVPECYGDIATPKVQEGSRSVTVTLTRVPPKVDGDVACIEIALLKTVDIELQQPLGDRVLRDGAFRGAQVPEGPPPAPAAG